MENHHRRFHPRILEVGIELRQELRHHHALVDDGAGRQGRDIKDRVAGFQFLFGAPTRHKQLAVEGGLIEVAARIHENLLDGRQGLERLRTTGLAVHRQDTEAGDLQLLELQLLGENPSRLTRKFRVPIEEHQAGGKQRGQLEPGLRGRGLQKSSRLLDQETAAIPGLAVRGNRTAVSQAIEGADGRLQNPVTGLIVETCDQAESAGIPLIGRPVKTPIPNTRVPAAPAGFKRCSVSLCHILRPC